MYKSFLPLFLIVALTGNSQAYTLMDDDLRLAQDYMQGDMHSSEDIQDAGRFEQSRVNRKKPWVAAILALQPLYVVPLAVGSAASRGDVLSTPSWAVMLSSFALGPIPAHIYARSSWKTTLGFFLARNGVLAASLFGWSVVAAISYANAWGSDDDRIDTGPWGLFFVGGIIGYLVLYVIEISSVLTSVEKYNERESQKSSFYLQPLAVPGEYHLRMGYRF